MSGETNQGSLKGHTGSHREATVKPTGTRSQMASNQAGALITQVLLKITQRASDWNGSRFLSCRMSLCWTATSNAKEEYFLYGHQTHTSGRKSPPLNIPSLDTAGKVTHKSKGAAQERVECNAPETGKWRNTLSAEKTQWEVGGRSRGPVQTVTGEARGNMENKGNKLSQTSGSRFVGHISDILHIRYLHYNS